MVSRIKQTEKIPRPKTDWSFFATNRIIGGIKAYLLSAERNTLFFVPNIWIVM